MPSAPELADRDDMTLWASGVMLDDLLALAPAWEQRTEAERLDFFLEWEEMMDRLAGVASEGERGHLTAEQHETLARVAARIATSRPTIERLGLDYPDLGRISQAS